MDDDVADIGSGRKGSVLAARAARAGGAPGGAQPRFATNEEVVKALQEQVEVRTAKEADTSWTDLCVRAAGVG